MYTEAAESYDSTNRILSFNADSGVRGEAAKIVMMARPSRILDIATGTGDMAIGIAELAEMRGERVSVTGIDRNKSMLAVAKRKAMKRGVRGVRFEAGDVSEIRYGDGSFDAVCCSFSTKNFPDLGIFVKESKRVLRKGGIFVITDISRPEGILNNALFGIYLLYMKLIAAFAGKRLYRWLPGSTSGFSKRNLVGLLGKNGLRDIVVRDFFFGIAYIISCRK